MKIVDKMRKATEEGTKFYSFEFFPPRTDEVCILADNCSPVLV